MSFFVVSAFVVSPEAGVAPTAVVSLLVAAFSELQPVVIDAVIIAAIVKHKMSFFIGVLI